MELKKNMGSTDRIVRVVIATILAYLYFTGVISGTLGLIGVILAIVFLITSLFSFCPLYLPFGMSTRK